MKTLKTEYVMGKLNSLSNEKGDVLFMSKNEYGLHLLCLATGENKRVTYREGREALNK